MDRTRRSFLKGVAAAGTGMAAAAVPAFGATAKPAAPADAVGLLYDTTRCIGCKACMTSSRRRSSRTTASPDFAVVCWRTRRRTPTARSRKCAPLSFAAGA